MIHFQITLFQVINHTYHSNQEGLLALLLNLERVIHHNYNKAEIHSKILRIRKRNMTKAFQV